MRATRQLEGSVGQGALEVLGVVALFGAAVAVAWPTYIGFQERSADGAARANLAAAVPAAEAYRADHGSYRGLDATDLLRIDPRVSATVAVVKVGPRRYCLTETVRGRTWSLAGPAKRQARYRPNASCR
jgi:Tfp pilus assembly protein PilE